MAVRRFTKRLETDPTLGKNGQTLAWDDFSRAFAGSATDLAGSPMKSYAADISKLVSFSVCNTGVSYARISPSMERAPAEIVFQVTEDEVDGGFNAEALGYSIFTQADSADQLREMVKDAVRSHFGKDLPAVIRLHFIRQEAFAP
jgi:hypothetical protein